MKMKLVKRASALGLAVLLGTPLASSAVPSNLGDGVLDIGGKNYLGAIHDEVSGTSADKDFINCLILLPAGEGNTLIPPGTGDVYSRLGSSLSGPFPTAISQGFLQDNTGGATINAAGFSYVLATYGSGGQAAGSLVWFVGGDAQSVTVPTTFDGNRGTGLLFVSLFDSQTTTQRGRSVPEGGMTLLLMGAAWAGLVAWRRKLV